VILQKEGQVFDLFASERKTNYFLVVPPKKNHIFARYLTKLQAYDSSNFRYSNSVAHYTDDGLQGIWLYVCLRVWLVLVLLWLFLLPS